MTTLNPKRQHGLVTIEMASNGRWVWVEDEYGAIWCEIDCGCDLTQVPEHLRESVQSAFEWAREENRLLAEDEMTAKMPSREDEVADWQHDYYSTRGRFR